MEIVRALNQSSSTYFSLLLSFIFFLLDNILLFFRSVKPKSTQKNTNEQNLASLEYYEKRSPAKANNDYFIVNIGKKDYNIWLISVEH